MSTKKIMYALGCLIAASILASCGKPAATADSTPKTDRINMIVADWERAKKFTQAYLDSADDATISYKLSDKTPRTFGNQMIHFADANYGFAKVATAKTTDMGFGVLEGKGPDAFKTKADVAKAVMDSYDFVISALKEMNDTQLADTISTELFPGFNVKMTKEMMINKAFEHQTHHRGQATQYLRAQGKTPPQEMLF